MYTRLDREVIMRARTQQTAAAMLILFLSVAFFVWAKTAEDSPAQKADQVRVHYVALAKRCNIPVPARLFGGVGDINVARLQKMESLDIMKSAQVIMESEGFARYINKLDSKQKSDITITECIAGARYISHFIEDNRGSDALGDSEIIEKQVD